MHSASCLSRCRISFGASAAELRKLVGFLFFVFFGFVLFLNTAYKINEKQSSGFHHAQWSGELRPLACFTEADKGGVDVLKSVQWICRRSEQQRKL